MRALELDYLRAARRVFWARALLAAVAIAFACDTGYRYRLVSTDIEGKTTSLTRAAALERAPKGLAVTARHDSNEYQFARQTLGRLSTPWDQLFGALEAARTERVVLLAVEPDAENRAVTITGETKDYLTALAYLANLAQQGSLQRVHLVHHEMRRQPSATPLLFNISAMWVEPR